MIKLKTTMKKLITMIIILSVVTGAQAQQSLHDFTVKSIDGKDYDLAQLKGKKVLVVNTASKCGLTPQYKELEALYKKYKDQNLVIIGFPANNFLSQEPGSNEEIKEFCQLNYGVSFPMMAKISVRGKDIHPLYKWLTESTQSEVLWNFQKYLIDEEGKIVDFLHPKKSPMDQKIIDFITAD